METKTINELGDTGLMNQFETAGAKTIMFRRGDAQPLDISQTFSSMRKLIAYCINQQSYNLCPYEGQIVTVGTQLFILVQVTSASYTYEWTEIDAASGKEVAISFPCVFDTGTNRKHFRPVLHQAGGGGSDLKDADLDIKNLHVTEKSQLDGQTTFGKNDAPQTTIKNDTINTGTITAKNLNASDGVTVGSTGNQTTINKGTLTTGTSNANTVNTQVLNVTDTNGNTKASITVNQNGTSELAVGVINAEKMVAQIVEARKTTFVGGREILTVGGGCIIKSVAKSGADYVCELRLQTEAGLASNPFLIGDFVIMQTYGTDKQRQYWRRVIAVSGQTITLSGTDCNQNMTDAPMEGDTICQLGYAGNESANADRHYAIVLSSVTSSELPGISAPYIAMWDGITNHEWPSKPELQFSRTKNIITGDFYNESGESIDTKLEDLSRFGVDIEAIKQQTDKSYVIWFTNEVPTLYNYPYTEFDDVEEHLEDICYVVTDDIENEAYGTAYRFRNYEWQQITDQTILDALKKATDAQKKVGVLQTRVETSEKMFHAMTGLFYDGEFTEGSELTLTKDFANLITKATTTTDGVLQEWKSGIENDAKEHTAKLFTSVTDKDGNVTAASITAGINDGGSDVTINAQSINLNGYVSGTDDKWHIDNDGTAHFSSGTIAGWTIGADSISAKYTYPENGIEKSSQIVLNKSGQIYAQADGTSTPYWSLNANGSGSLANGNITWLADGSVDIKAKITATEGQIGNWNIANGTIYTANVTLGSDGTISCNNNAWRLDSNGDGWLANGNIQWDSNGTTLTGNVFADALYVKKVGADGNLTDEYVNVLAQNISAIDGDILQINNLKAVNGLFEGVVTAKAFYHATRNSIVGSTEELILNPSADNATCVLATYGATVQLPNPMYYEGLQYTIHINKPTVNASSYISIITHHSMTKMYYGPRNGDLLKVYDGGVTLCVIGGSWRVIATTASKIEISDTIA